MAAGIPFGIFMGIFYSLRYGFVPGLIVGVVAGIFFGGFMSLILGFLHSWSVKRVSSGKSEKAMGVHHVRNVELRLPYDKAFDLGIKSLSLIEKCNVQKEDRPQGKIVAKAGVTWRTWGDVISFEVRKIGDDRIQVEVSSRPSVRTTLIDYGKNLQNVEKIVRFLNARGGIAV